MTAGEILSNKAQQTDRSTMYASIDEYDFSFYATEHCPAIFSLRLAEEYLTSRVLELKYKENLLS